MWTGRKDKTTCVQNESTGRRQHLRHSSFVSSQPLVTSSGFAADCQPYLREWPRRFGGPSAGEGVWHSAWLAEAFTAPYCDLFSSSQPSADWSVSPRPRRRRSARNRAWTASVTPPAACVCASRDGSGSSASTAAAASGETQTALIPSWCSWHWHQRSSFRTRWYFCHNLVYVW